MKDHSQAAFQYSGYPLTIVEPKQQITKPRFIIIRPETPQQTTAIQKSTISNDPKNWDENWFNGYE